MMHNDIAPNARSVVLQAMSSRGALDDCKRYLSEGAGEIYTGRAFGVGFQIDPNIVSVDHLDAVRRLSLKRNIFPEEQSKAFSKLSAVTELLGSIADSSLREMPDYINHSAQHTRGDLNCCAWGRPDELWFELPKVSQFGGLVTRSKLLSRLRPNLFPVYDRVVGKALGIGDGRRLEYSLWGTFRAIVADPQIWSLLIKVQHQLKQDLQGNPFLEGVTPLRVMDIALWMKYH